MTLEKIRILMITTNSYEGRYWQDIAIDFKFRNEELGLMSLKGCQRPVWSEQTPHVTLFGNSKRENERLGNIVYLIRKAIAFKPDVIQTHLFYGGLFGLLVGKLMRIPVVVTRHHIDEHFIVGTPIHRYLDRLTIKLGDAVIVRSSAARDWLILKEKGNPKSIFVINQGFNFDLLSVSLEEIDKVKMDLGFDDDTFNILCVARYSRAKGQEYLLDAIKSARKKVSSLRLFFIGPGDPSWLEELVKHSGLSSIIRILPSRSDIPACLAAADLVVHPSLVDSFSQLLIEVQAVGTAIVATDIAAASEQIMDGVTGIIVPPRDWIALASAIEKLYLDPKLRESMGKEGSILVQQKYQVQEMVEKDVGVLRSVL